MATKKQTSQELSFDLATFKKQKEELARVASTQVADKISAIKIMISEIQELVALSGMTLNLKNELSYAIECVDELHPDWNSSSYDC